MVGITRRELLALSASSLSLALSGCSGYTDGMAVEEILALLRASAEDAGEEDSGDSGETSGSVRLALTYPAGRSPKVFTSGWVFGARCLNDDEDMSDTVKWSGSGVFNPDTGATSRPVFNSEGQNTITLSVTVGEKTIQKSFNVTAVSAAAYAAMGSNAQCLADAHGCPACPHPVKGPIISGSPNVFVNGKPAARVGDRGIHAACCGPNSYEIVSGDPEVLINGRSAARLGSATRHCGGNGQIVSTG